MDVNKIYNENCLETMSRMADKSIDLIFTDPPYALGSEVIIRPDGKPDYKKAVDFMNKWQQPNGDFWEKWFKEAMRILKYGGRVVMFSIDRQCMIAKYFACFAGFTENQSMYWYSVQSFPKSSDLSKMLDKNAGVEREVVGSKVGQPGYSLAKEVSHKGYNKFDNPESECSITAPATPLAKKYNGYKYSIAPLKQTNETILIFFKLYKTGSCLHDVLAYENGDQECCCGALNIEGGRVPIKDKEEYEKKQLSFRNSDTSKQIFSSVSEGLNPAEAMISSRYPAQTFVDSGAAEVLDEQSKGKMHCSGSFLSKEDANKKWTNKSKGCFDTSFLKGLTASNRIGDIENIDGCSKILHHCDFDREEHDLYIYCPKAAPNEREDYNNHPTLKPVALITKLLQLFKTPNPQVIYDPFMGSGTTAVVCKSLQMDYIGSEISADYCKIAEKRLKKSESNWF